MVWCCIAPITAPAVHLFYKTAPRKVHGPPLVTMHLVTHCSEGSNELGNRREEMGSVIGNRTASGTCSGTEVLLALGGDLGNAGQLLLTDAQERRPPASPVSPVACEVLAAAPSRRLVPCSPARRQAGRSPLCHSYSRSTGRSHIHPCSSTRCNPPTEGGPRKCRSGKHSRLLLARQVPRRWSQLLAGLRVRWIVPAQEPRRAHRKSVSPLQQFGVHFRVGLGGHLLLGLPQRGWQVLQVEVSGRPWRATRPTRGERGRAAAGGLSTTSFRRAQERNGWYPRYPGRHAFRSQRTGAGRKGHLAGDRRQTSILWRPRLLWRETSRAPRAPLSWVSPLGRPSPSNPDSTLSLGFSGSPATCARLLHPLWRMARPRPFTAHRGQLVVMVWWRRVPGSWCR